jgi:hypothetical protein
LVRLRKLLPGFSRPLHRWVLRQGQPEPENVDRKLLYWLLPLYGIYHIYKILLFYAASALLCLFFSFLTLCVCCCCSAALLLSVCSVVCYVPLTFCAQLTFAPERT